MGRRFGRATTRKPSLTIRQKASTGVGREAWSKLTQADQAELARLADDEIASSNWFARRAWVFIRANPWLVLRGAFRKLEAGFSPRLNPIREPLAQAAYAIGYVPVAVFGVIGMFLARQRGGVILIEMLFLAFMCVTAVFWAHTSHRSYLDVYLIVFAASTLESFRRRLKRLYEVKRNTADAPSRGVDACDSFLQKYDFALASAREQRQFNSSRVQPRSSPEAW